VISRNILLSVIGLGLILHRLGTLEISGSDGRDCRMMSSRKLCILVGQKFPRIFAKFLPYHAALGATIKHSSFVAVFDFCTKDMLKVLYFRR